MLFLNSYKRKSIQNNYKFTPILKIITGINKVYCQCSALIWYIRKCKSKHTRSVDSTYLKFWIRLHNFGKSLNNYLVTHRIIDPSILSFVFWLGSDRFIYYVKDFIGWVSEGSLLKFELGSWVWVFFPKRPISEPALVLLDILFANAKDHTDRPLWPQIRSYST